LWLRAGSGTPWYRPRLDQDLDILKGFRKLWRQSVQHFDHYLLKCFLIHRSFLG
jgi:hypothetical protein